VAQVLIVGSGGLGRETLAALRESPERFEPIGFLDDDPGRRGILVDGLPVVGTVDEVTEYPEAQVILATASPSSYGSRRRIARRLDLPAWRYTTVVHPRASGPPGVAISQGAVILAGCVATAPSIEIGAHSVLMPGVILTHDCTVGAFATLGAGVLLAGGTNIGEGAYLGSGSMIREGVSIGPWALIGMGSVVLHDIPPGEVWAGNPARYLRDSDEEYATTEGQL